METNITAFLTTIAISEGTNRIGNRGYNCIAGSRAERQILFDSYDDHPRVRVQLRNDDPRTPQDEDLWSSAAGRYQILARIYDAYKVLLGLKDFSPASQDAIVIQILKEQRAYDCILQGNFAFAIARTARIWASFPGAGYTQRENTLTYLSKVYADAGGTIIMPA